MSPPAAAPTSTPPRGLPSLNETNSNTVLSSSRRAPSSIPTSFSGNTIQPEMEPTRTHPRNTVITRNATTNGSNRIRATAITVVEPIRERAEHQPQPPSQTKKVLNVISNGFGVLAYFLCICCVLSGEQRPQAKKTRKGYYYQYDDDFGGEGTRARKVESGGQSSVSSKPRSERVR